MDHFWIILGSFSTTLLTVRSTVCQWSCGLVDHFLEAKLLEQVNLHFWIFYNTHCWFNMLLGTCTMSNLYPGHGPEDIRTYPGHMTQDTVAVISWVMCPEYLLISLGHVANHQGR